MKSETRTILNQTQAQLDKVSGELIAELIALAEGSYGLSKNSDSNKVHQVDIELFEDGYRLVAYPMSAQKEQLGHKTLLANYQNGVLRDSDYDLDYDLYDDDEEIDEFYQLQKEMFIQWFITCWKQTGKLTLPKPIFLMVHDEGNSVYDLQNGSWV